MLSERLNYSALHSLRHGGHPYFSANPAANFLRNPMLAAGVSPAAASIYGQHPQIFMNSHSASMARIPGLQSLPSQTPHTSIASLLGHSTSSAAAFAAAAAAATAAVAATNYQQSIMAAVADQDQAHGSLDESVVKGGKDDGDRNSPLDISRSSRKSSESPKKDDQESP